MIKTRVTELLGIKYPILMGGMHWVSFSKMVAAIANAGGLGFIPSASFKSVDALRDEIKKANDLTDGPIGLNISLLPNVDPGEIVMDFLELGVKEGVAAFETAGRPPDRFVPILKEAKIPVIHKVPQVRFAKKAQDIGVDAVIVVGFECAGYVGGAEITTQILVNKASKVLDIPVIAGGGITNGKSLVSALALGAEGVLMGTRFLASKESGIHKNYKEWLTKASETDTMVILKSISMPVRSIKNEAALKLAEIEADGGTMEELLTFAADKMGKAANEKGDVDMGLISMGEGIGLIDEVKTIKEIVKDMVAEAEEVMGRLNKAIVAG